MLSGMGKQNVGVCIQCKPLSLKFSLALQSRTQTTHGIFQQSINQTGLNRFSLHNMPISLLYLKDHWQLLLSAAFTSLYWKIDLFLGSMSQLVILHSTTINNYVMNYQFPQSDSLFWGDKISIMNLFLTLVLVNLRTLTCPSVLTY